MYVVMYVIMSLNLLFKECLHEFFKDFMLSQMLYVNLIFFKSFYADTLTGARGPPPAPRQNSPRQNPRPCGILL